MKWILPCIFLWAHSLSLAQSEDERIWVETRINGQPARMIFDTGCDRLLLFGPSARRLGLNVSNPPDNMKTPVGSPPLGLTDSCEFILWGKTAKVKFNVFDSPEILGLKADGIIGWNYLGSNIFEFDAVHHHMEIGQDLPTQVSDWLRLPLAKESGCLVLKIPRPQGGVGSVAIDTGSMGEISLSPGNWQKWKREHPRDPSTLTSYYMPGAGTVIREVMWARKIKIGPLEFANVLLKQSNIAEEAAGDAATYEATLPLDVLRQQDLVIDGQKGFAYFSPKKIPANLPDYNRLGAVFVPRNSKSSDLIAHVASDSPAEKAGIRNGDILLKVGTHDVTLWRSQVPETPTALQFERPEGTKLELTLKRDKEEYRTIAVLRNLLDPKGVTGFKR